MRNISRLLFFLKKILNILKWFILFSLKGTLNTPSKKLRKQNRIFVMGNGPSLTNDIQPYIDLLKRSEVMMVNQALTNSLAFQIKPRFYCLMDPDYWKISAPTEERQKQLESDNKKLEHSFEKVDWEMIVFTPWHFYANRDASGVKIQNPLIKIQPFNAVELISFAKIDSFLYSKNYAIPSGINVLIAGLCCAIAMQYKQIYLLGADSDWHKQMRVDYNNKLYLDYSYFYDKKNTLYMPYNVSYFYRCFLQTFLAYDRLAELNFPIYNLSSNSMIDSFPRKNIADVIK